MQPPDMNAGDRKDSVIDSIGLCPVEKLNPSQIICLDPFLLSQIQAYDLIGVEFFNRTKTNEIYGTIFHAPSINIRGLHCV